MSRCGHGLAAFAANPLAAEHPTIDAQRLVCDVVATDRAAFGVFEVRLVSARDGLGVVQNFANRVINSAAFNGLASVLPADALEPTKD